MGEHSIKAGGPRLNNSPYELAVLTPRTLGKVARPDGDNDGECWIWKGRIDDAGYGHIQTAGADLLAHRLFYFKIVGPTDLTLDHLCRNRRCVNPAHLEPVTHAENVRRGEAGHYLRERTACPAGHPYAGENLYVYPSGRRSCRACNRAARRRYYQRVRGGHAAVKS